MRVLVFAKAPVAGQVKTRLIPVLGAERACGLHQELVERTLRRLLPFRDALELWCAPDASHGFFAQLGAHFDIPLHEQQGDGLGERMHHATTDALGRAGKAVLVGTDAPMLDHTMIAAACAALDTHDAVFAPAEDGGYALVGLRNAMPIIFQDMPWGSDEVMASTRERLAATGAAWHELPTVWDLDRPEDLQRYRTERACEADATNTRINKAES